MIQVRLQLLDDEDEVLESILWLFIDRQAALEAFAEGAEEITADRATSGPHPTLPRRPTS